MGSRAGRQAGRQVEPQRQPSWTSAAKRALKKKDLKSPRKSRERGTSQTGRETDTKHTHRLPLRALSPTLSGFNCASPEIPTSPKSGIANHPTKPSSHRTLPYGSSSPGEATSRRTCCISVHTSTQGKGNIFFPLWIWHCKKNQLQYEEEWPQK